MKPEQFRPFRGTGGMATVWLAQPLASLVSSALARLHPSNITALGGTLSVVSSLVVLFVGCGPVAVVVAMVGWNLAYVLDCSDGQVARATGRTSAAGARLDAYVDVLTHCSAAAAVVAVATPAAVWQLVLAGIFAGTRPLGSLLPKDDHYASAVEGQAVSSPRPRRPWWLVATRQAYDYPVQATFLACALWQPKMAWVGIAALTALSCAQLGARIARTYVASLHSAPTAPARVDSAAEPKVSHGPTSATP